MHIGEDVLDIATAIAEHKADIDALRTAVVETIAAAPAIDADRYDDTLLLRYILSFKDVEKAAAALVKSAEYRAKNADALAAARSWTPVRPARLAGWAK